MLLEILCYLMLKFLFVVIIYGIFIDDCGKCIYLRFKFFL